MSEVNNLLNKAQRLKTIVIGRATHESFEDDGYIALRRDLIDTAHVRQKIPNFVIQCRTLGEFWTYIKARYSHYQERREYISNEFAPVLEMLELENITPGDDAVTAALATVDSEHVRAAWEKALERRSIDPEGPT